MPELDGGTWVWLSSALAAVFTGLGALLTRIFSFRLKWSKVKAEEWDKGYRACETAHQAKDALLDGQLAEMRRGMVRLELEQREQELKGEITRRGLEECHRSHDATVQALHWIYDLYRGQHEAMIAGGLQPPPLQPLPSLPPLLTEQQIEFDVRSREQRAAFTDLNLLLGGQS